MSMNNLIPIERIENKIYLLRGQKVMLDKDLAQLYGVMTKRLNEQVKRNIKRFPEDFMFSLSKEEIMRMSQIATSSSLKFSKNVNAFTEQGVAMLSSVINSERAIQVNIQIMRTFTKLRQLLAGNDELRRKVESLERKYDKQFSAVFTAIKRLIAPPAPKKKRIGFLREDEA